MPTALPYATKKLLRAPAMSRSTDNWHFGQTNVLSLSCRLACQNPQLVHVFEVPGSSVSKTCRPAYRDDAHCRRCLYMSSMVFGAAFSFFTFASAQLYARRHAEKHRFSSITCSLVGIIRTQSTRCKDRRGNRPFIHRRRRSCTRRHVCHHCFRWSPPRQT